MRTATRYAVRRMRIDDIPQVLEVERESFPTMWPPTAFKRELQQNRLAHYIVVVEHDADSPLRMSWDRRTTGPFGRLLGRAAALPGHGGGPRTTAAGRARRAYRRRSSASGCSPTRRTS